MSIFSTFLELHFSGLKSIVFYPEYQKMFLYGFFLLEKNTWEKGRFSDKSHELIPLQNVDFFYFARTSLFRSKKHSFLSRRSKNVSFWLSLLKRTDERTVHFLRKPWTKPFAKCPFFNSFLELILRGVKTILFYPE